MSSLALLYARCREQALCGLQAALPFFYGPKGNLWASMEGVLTLNRQGFKIESWAQNHHAPLTSSPDAKIYFSF